MTLSRTQALADIHRKLAQLDRTQILCRSRSLADEDLTWQERSMELRARVMLIVADGPTQDLLDAIGAHIVAYKQALAASEEVSVTSGEAA